ALAAARHQQLLALAREIAELLVRVGIPHHRAERHRHVEIRAAAARAVVGSARLAVGGPEGPLDAEIRQCVDPRGGAQVDAASVAAVAAGRRGLTLARSRPTVILGRDNKVSIIDATAGRAPQVAPALDGFMAIRRKGGYSKCLRGLLGAPAPV